MSCNRCACSWTPTVADLLEADRRLGAPAAAATEAGAQQQQPAEDVRVVFASERDRPVKVGGRRRLYEIRGGDPGGSRNADPDPDLCTGLVVPGGVPACSDTLTFIVVLPYRTCALLRWCTAALQVQNFRPATASSARSGTLRPGPPGTAQRSTSRAAADEAASVKSWGTAATATRPQAFYGSNPGTPRSPCPGSPTPIRRYGPLHACADPRPLSYKRFISCVNLR